MPTTGTSGECTKTCASQPVPKLTQSAPRPAPCAHATVRVIIPRTVRNGAHLRRSSLDKVCRDNPPLECSVCSHELPSLLRSSRLWRRSSDNKAESCSERAGISSMVLNGNIDLGAVPVLTTAINSRSLFPICWDSFDKWEVFNPLSNT